MENKSSTCTEVWDKCLKIIKDNLANDYVYDTWFKPCVAIELKGATLTISVPSPYFYEYLEANYIDLLSFALRMVLGKDAELHYKVHVVTKGSTVTYPTNPGIHVKNPPMPFPNKNTKQLNPFIIPGLQQMEINPQLNSNKTFGNFVESDCNRTARSSGLAIAENPGKVAFNPMFVFGGSGLGKTHLVQAIGLEIKRKFPDKIVLYVMASLFQNQYIDAQIYNNNLNDFLNFYQMMDVLIIDDIQEFAGKEGTQSAFFQIFNHLHQSGKQLIFTSDRPPVDLSGLNERLLTRFRWGLTVELKAPDFETRKAILKKKIFNEGIEMSDEIVEYIASKVTTNIRELEGVFTSLYAESIHNAGKSKKIITIEMAKNVIDYLVNSTKREISIDKIKRTVCDYFGLSIDIIYSKTRKREIVQARQIAMYFARNMTKHSLAMIGVEIGGKDHATVLHACKIVEDIYDTDKVFRQHVTEIEKRINNSL
ncbi:MAG: chromosomal replication initiator protein DnaA [Prevotellaceae bacterium]|jgi:chromosomal replication initiator protein|nr:chromosomal replication initiator protein DnaA [Prevotellaceae bacterium]